MKYKILAVILAGMIFSCEPQPCEVETYVLEPILKKIYFKIPDSTFYEHELLLTNLGFDTEVRFDTTFVDDSIVVNQYLDTINNCTIRISGDFYDLNEKDSITFGNPQAGGTYSQVKLKVEKINLNIQAVDLMLWKYRFTQDCTNW